MKTETPPQPTIAELWGKLQNLNISIGMNEWTLAHPRHFSRPIVLNRIQERNALRQQLLELCKGDFFLQAAATCKENMIEYHKEMSACHAFWAWEVEQRQKEEKNG